jgi:hypothetical protein
MFRFFRGYLGGWRWMFWERGEMGGGQVIVWEGGEDFFLVGVELGRK